MSVERGVPRARVVSGIATAPVDIRPVASCDRAWVDATVASAFGSPRVVSRGVLHDCAKLDGLLAVRQGEPRGVLLYEHGDAAWQVVVLIATLKRSGIGRRLLGAVADLARAAGARTLWLVTTNDNLPAIELYRRCGWSLEATHRGAIAAARRLEPEIPETGHDGVPIRDELEFVLRPLGGGPRHPG